MNMPRTIVFALMALVFLLQSCDPSDKPVDERLKKSYSGYYKTCERIRLDFRKYDCECTISSTDFVGNFCDEISGTYTIDSNRINIQWNDVAKGNDVYTELPLNIADSIILSSSGDSLLLYLPDKSEILTIEAQSQTLKDKAGVVLFYGMILLFLLILCSPFIVIVTVIYLIAKRKKLK